MVDMCVLLPYPTNIVDSCILMLYCVECILGCIGQWYIFCIKAHRTTVNLTMGRCFDMVFYCYFSSYCY